MKDKQREHLKSQAIIAHSIAQQIVDIPGITFYGALDLVDLVRKNIELKRDFQQASIFPEIRDRYGTIIETPQAEAQGEAEEISP